MEIGKGGKMWHKIKITLLVIFIVLILFFLYISVFPCLIAISTDGGFCYFTSQFPFLGGGIE